MHMGVTVSVISGKGGTGKTTLCAGIAACLAAEGKRVLCIDADIGLRNLDIALGMAEQPAVSFTDVTQGFCKLSDAAEHPALPGLFLLTAPVREQDALVEQQRFGALLREAREAFDWVLIDAAAGIGTSFRLATQFADRCIVAATPDPASLRDAACAADALALEGHELLQLVVNRVQPRLFSRSADFSPFSTGAPARPHSGRIPRLSCASLRVFYASIPHGGRSIQKFRMECGSSRICHCEEAQPTWQSRSTMLNSR